MQDVAVTAVLADADAPAAASSSSAAFTVTHRHRFLLSLKAAIFLHCTVLGDT